jgi:hypothetical protein
MNMETIINIILAIIQLFGLYPRAGVIKDIDYGRDVYVIEDKAGLIWEYGGIQDLWYGENTAMLVWDNGTPESIYDDVIMGIR